MCGIYGLIRSGAAASGADLDRMTEALRHRGPDAVGRADLGGAIVGHTRLRIIDLSDAAAQPLWDTDRRACIVFNGEVYNFRELREECESAGMRFHSQSDTEVIVNEYLLHGASAFDRLNGIFAFALFDASSGDVWLVRDPMGVKPLYFAIGPYGVLFASELGCLISSGLLKPEVDLDALAAYLQMDFVPSPMSMIRGVRKLEGGEALRIGPDGTLDRLRYSHLDSMVDQVRRPVEEDHDEFARRIHEAVERQLVADVPVGCFLSGGIDSSIVAQVASRITGGRIGTYSVGFDDPSFDETKYFTEVSRELGLRQRVEVLDPAAMIDLVPEVPRILSEPVADASIFPTFLLARFARREVTVALSGDGADELFGGYPTYRAARWAARIPAWLHRPVRAGLTPLAHALLPVRHTNLSFDFRIKKFLEGLEPDPIRRNRNWLGTFSPAEIDQLVVAARSMTGGFADDRLQAPGRRVAKRDLLERLLRTDQRFYLQDQVLVKVDRASMACSLEVRVPFLDLEMVELAHRLPADRKLRGGTTKWILREYARRHLPRSISQRPKKGFGVPLGRWFSGELRDLVGDVLGADRVRAAGIFDAQMVQRILAEHWSRRRDHRKKIFNLLMFSLWHDWLQRTSGAVRGFSPEGSTVAPGTTATRVEQAPQGQLL